MQAWDYQVEVATQGYEIMRKYGIVYLSMEERTGKSIPTLLIARMLGAKSVLIVTQKKALVGWTKTLNEFDHGMRNVQLINYHSVDKVVITPDVVILDEPHNYCAAYPKTSGIWSKVHKAIGNAQVIYSSATPHAQGPQQLFHQFALSRYSPWSMYRDFYDWFKAYAQRDDFGRLKTIRISATQDVIDYSAVQVAKIMHDVKHLFVSYTRKELGFEQEPEDIIHWIELNEVTRYVYNTLVKTKVLAFTHRETGKDYELICDTPAKLRYALHMVEGGVLKVGEQYLSLGNTEKIDFILKTWGDTEDLVIMYQYVQEGVKLNQYFKKAKILQGTSNAEGVDLHKHKHLVIYSQDFSTAKHTQRRARQANKNREDEIHVHYLLVKKATSEQVYKTCSINKVNFVDSRFEKETI